LPYGRVMVPLKPTSERAETLRRNGIPIKGLTDTNGMHFTKSDHRRFVHFLAYKGTLFRSS
jgi:hypothetical protein